MSGNEAQVKERSAEFYHTKGDGKKFALRSTFPVICELSMRRHWGRTPDCRKAPYITFVKILVNDKSHL